MQLAFTAAHSNCTWDELASLWDRAADAEAGAAMACIIPRRPYDDPSQSTAVASELAPMVHA